MFNIFNTYNFLFKRNTYLSNIAREVWKYIESHQLKLFTRMKRKILCVIPWHKPKHNELGTPFCSLYALVDREMTTSCLLNWMLILINAHHYGKSLISLQQLNKTKRFVKIYHGILLLQHKCNPTQNLLRKFNWNALNPFLR